jgi:hypothetical protein
MGKILRFLLALQHGAAGDAAAALIQVESQSTDNM